MKKVVLLSTMFVALAAYAVPPDTYTGVVSDAMCAKNNVEKASKPDHAACAAKCIKGGSPAVMIIDGKIVNVANPDKIEAYAGKTITVEGSMEEGKLMVASVKEKE